MGGLVVSCEPYSGNEFDVRKIVTLATTPSMSALQWCPIFPPAFNRLNCGRGAFPLFLWHDAMVIGPFSPANAEILAGGGILLPLCDDHPGTRNYVAHLRDVLPHNLEVFLSWLSSTQQQYEIVVPFKGVAPGDRRRTSYQTIPNATGAQDFYDSSTAIQSQGRKRAEA